MEKETVFELILTKKVGQSVLESINEHIEALEKVKKHILTTSEQKNDEDNEKLENLKSASNVRYIYEACGTCGADEQIVKVYRDDVFDYQFCSYC